MLVWFDEIFIILTFVSDSAAYSGVLAVFIGEILSSEGFWKFLGGAKDVS